ncbi:Uncharacterized protein YoxC, contains an MCP-like domain [Lentibacillus halodurans]|uniref:Uncharacterized protein YoxC, contains an MCP-like domain n=1 Tax=Lentibacillus halodurans TaxID=237679 RepID=A0A1I1AMJ0_9BACI|nr:DUF948 domain-containing protein [Lentibacillus halodurans]SFB37533.1 Uncharacterized protein YoxC, contains an MCP-like domain [Lentibacillus halodurans]
MDWIGIGMIIIGLALLGLVFLLIKPLQKLTAVLSGLQNTTNELPVQVADIMAGTKNTLNSANNVIRQLNEQLGKLGTAFQIIGHVGQSMQNLFAVMTSINKEMERKTDNAMMSRYHLEGIYGVMALGYAIFQRQKTK